MALWDVLVTARDDAGNRVTLVQGTYAPGELADALEAAARHAGEIGGGIQVVRHLDPAPEPPVRVA
jgi:hypothetical protein